MMDIHKFLLALLVLFFSCTSLAAVILQYHHIDGETPASTSVSIEEFNAHLEWLEHNDFKITGIKELLKKLSTAGFDNTEKLVVLSFDDSGISVCDVAWPILKKRKLPFVVFISTSIMKVENPSRCSWQQLRQMEKSGLMVAGNHSHTHPHMLDVGRFANMEHWKTFIVQEIQTAQAIIDRELGEQPRFFAYPYGEHNPRLESIVEKSGYVAFGQHSGAVGSHSSLVSLPRFPLSGHYANLERFSDKMYSLPLPILSEVYSPNPVYISSIHNPPLLTLELEGDFNYRVQCYLGSGERIITQQEGSVVNAKASMPISTGRNRYNCTAPSDIPGRFYWYSRQWLVE